MEDREAEHPDSLRLGTAESNTGTESKDSVLRVGYPPRSNPTARAIIDYRPVAEP